MHFNCFHLKSHVNRLSAAQVLVGWGMDKPFTLEFDLFAVIMLTLSVILASFVTYDGSSNYLLGVQLICVYLLLTVAYLLGAAK